ncbi:MAG: sensor histidine kinase [Gammaproteobacteria bacterium]|nr:MAG: sensor histidine kinase [Gammaproteobacteria bacterium]
MEEGQALLPNPCQPQAVLVAVLGGELLALVLTLASAPLDGRFWSELSQLSLFVQWIVLGTVAVLCLLHRLIVRLSLMAQIVVVFIVGMGMSLLMSQLALWLMLHQGLDRVVRVTPESLLVKTGGITFILLTVLLRYFWVQQQWRASLQARASAQVQALQARIRPHFLFNSMNTIASLIGIDPQRAERAVEDLSSLFRAALASEERRPLAEELELARRYLEIEQLRLGERLRVSWVIDPELDQRRQVPALCLQPLVENAVYHGIEPLPEGGEVRIEVRGEGGRLCVEVENPQPEAGGGEGRRGNHMAQANIRERLRLLYGERSCLEVRTGQGRYRVRFCLPREDAE